jgi:V/A-type H+/Na+-transporting ATPase subunit I
MFVGKSNILLKMLRPERMTSASIICIKKDIESVLEALSSFGEFHIEQTSQADASVVDYDQNIQKNEESLADVNWLIKQVIQEKSSFLSIFQTSTPTKIQVTAENWRSLLDETSQKIYALKEETERFNESLSCLQEKAAELNHLNDMLTKMKIMEANLAGMEELKLIYVAIASVPVKNFSGLEIALSGLPVFIYRCYFTKESIFTCLAASKKHQTDIEKIMRTYHAEIFQIPEELPHDVNEALKEVNKQIKENSDKEKAICNSLNKLGNQNKTKLFAWRETSENILALLNAERKILQSGRLATIKGFVPQKRFNELREKVNGKVDGKVLVLTNEVAAAEDPPTKICHNRFVKPFEELTRLYGLPHYEEFDPTPFMAISFPILFGLMFGDMGHGLILLVGGLAMFFLIKGNQGIKNVCWIMATCGLAAIVAGALYGEFFGKALLSPFPLWFDPFSPSTNVFSFLIFALIIGVVQILSGLVLDMANFAIKHDFVNAIFLSIPRIAFYLCAVYLIIVYKLNIAVWFSGPVLLLIIPFVLMVIAKPTFVAFSHLSKRSIVTQHVEKSDSETPEGFGQSLFEGGDFMTRSLSNTISYTRILALLMAHWALLLVTYTVADLIGFSSTLSLIISGIVIVGGNIFVIALEGLIVFIHTLRLHFYEWFSKFYKGTGTEFNPFKQKFIHTDVVLKERKSKVEH